MPITVSEASVAGVHVGDGITRQSLFGDAQLSGTNVTFDRFTLAAGASVPFNLAANSLVWLHMLSGEAMLQTPYARDRLSESGSILLLPGFETRVSTDAGASVLRVEIPDTARLGANVAPGQVSIFALDWTREPVLRSERDGRKRIRLVNADLSGTKAMHVEMLVHPAGIAGLRHHHEGADHFLCFMSGQGIVSAGGGSISVRAGDLVCLRAGEIHAIKAGEGAELRFLELFVPGTYKTIAADRGQGSAWVQTGRDIMHRIPARDPESVDLGGSF